MLARGEAFADARGTHRLARLDHRRYDANFKTQGFACKLQRLRIALCMTPVRKVVSGYDAFRPKNAEDHVDKRLRAG